MTLLQLLKRKHKTLVLVGPQGCGKTLLAQQLAKDVGNYIEIFSDELLESGTKFTPWLQDSPNVVIVDGDIKRANIPEVVATVIPNLSYCFCRNKESELIKTPIFIFCATDTKGFDIHNHIFHIIRMDEL